MYSYEDKTRAIELYLRYDRSAAAVINELGYPNRHTLRLWHMEFPENGDLGRGRHRRYDDLQKRAAVDHFFDHGQCLARTVRQLGYPKSKELLASWVDELEPGRRRRRAKAGSFTDDQKREAVIALASRKAPAQKVADAVGVTRAVLCKWKDQLLGEEAPCKMEAVPKDMVDDVDALRSQAAELQEQIKRLELRKAILEGAVELLGKDQGVDPGMPTNREKALIANSLRPARRLNEMLSGLDMGGSGCQYQAEAMSRPTSMRGRGGAYPRSSPPATAATAIAESAWTPEERGREGLGEGRRKADARARPGRQARQETEVQLLQRRDIRRPGEPGEAQLPRRCAEQAAAHRHHRVQDTRRQGLSQPRRGLLRRDDRQLGHVDLAERGARERHAGRRRRNPVGGRAPGRAHRPRVPLPLAGLDREVREVRHHEVDAEEGPLPGQQRLRGLLRALEGRAVLRQVLERVERRRLHGRGRPLHPLAQRAADQGIARGDEPAAVQAIAQPSGISAFVRKNVSIPAPKQIYFAFFTISDSIFSI